MTERDLSNFEIIYGLVKNHFSLNEAGLRVFKAALAEKRIEYIPENFRSLIGPDQRARFEVKSSLRENLDDGWNLFKDVFFAFCDNHNIEYENYSSNKLIVKKNEVKLFKFMKKWYETETDLTTKEQLANRAARKLNTGYYDNREDFDLMFKRITEKIGTMKLPDKKLEVVVSFNFADWFMCSTSEEWSSCLNLESDYDACFWSGLPGLITDPNRMLIYITDGKTKNYKGITVERMITRTWGLLGIDDVVYPNRHYPQTMMEDKAFSTMFPFDVARITLDDFRDFEGKYSTTDFITNTYNESIFIYQDYTYFKIVGYDPLKVKQVSGGSGYHKIVFGENSPYISEDTHYDYCDGLSGLIERDSKISDHEENGSSCCECGDHVHEDDLLWGNDDQQYCESCFSENFYNCEECGETVPMDFSLEGPDERLYCESCYSERFNECEECGDVINRSDLFVLDDQVLCESCHDDRFGTCGECGTQIHIDDLKDFEDETLCEECYKEKTTPELEDKEEGVA